MVNKYELAERYCMSLEFINWFLDTKKGDLGNAWFMMMGAMWEGWRAADKKTWIRCSDRMPDKDGAYLCWNGRHVATYAFIFGGWQANQFIVPNITHWMLLPEAPQPSSNSDGGLSGERSTKY